jgi:hypothetical protein
MAGSRSMRLVQAALRCYPERWRSRHGADAAELARLLIGRAAMPGEAYAAAADIFRPGEMLHCSAVLGESVRQAFPALKRLHVKIAWDTGTGAANRRSALHGHYYVAGGPGR